METNKINSFKSAFVEAPPSIHRRGKNKYLLESTLGRIQHFADGIIIY